MKPKSKNARETQVKEKQTAYEVRKKVRRDLVEEVKSLQKELGQLKFRLLVEQGEVLKATKRAETENDVLFDCIRKQHLVRAALQAALTENAQRNLNALQPVQSLICLGADPVERFNTLLALKERQLDNAERYLGARSHGLGPESTYCQDECFDSDEGDYCFVRFETVPVQGAHVKEVFDAVLDAILNQEIILSEMFGCVAIREDNDFETSEFTQLRLVTATSADTTVESNTLLFARFSDGMDDGKGGYGVLVSDFVNSDALYPYRTNERVRRDGTTIVTVRSLSSDIVFVTRWTCLKIHHSLSRDAETEMKESSVCWGDTSKRFIEQQLVHTSTSPSL
ncbi:uncharacterized protein PITG_07131 [Phytophthora infestans T30-4]|uniref:Uncharacterized protein n=2 Tax=Phytophthora infestans TaxID=4787 RepID=D0N7C5_PHYIT|nr:uncharacterized protein PITG_07131 [Phytophthora infestans T30-4]EEY53474.1 conserved hypothetical protein [Phytophthora infestans T30-4]|eukprot:XP_002905092.1 conserved hypothetical protein [Phytophthora infestans T30-4]